MSAVYVLLNNGAPVAAYCDEEAAYCAVLGLPSTIDPYLCLVRVLLNPELEADRDGVPVAAARERGASRAPGVSPVTLSPNGNKIT